MQPQPPPPPRRGASPWWYGLAAALVIGSIITVVALSSGNGTEHFRRLAPRALARVDEGDLDSVADLSTGTYAIVYRSTTLTRRDLVPRSSLSVRGGPFGKVRSLAVHNNPRDATVDLASPGYGGSPTTIDPNFGSTPTTLDPSGTAPTTVDPRGSGPTVGPSTTSPSNGFTFGAGQAEIATFEVTEAGQYQIRGAITSRSGQPGQPDPDGLLVLYPYRLADQFDAISHGFAGFLSRLGLSILIGVVGIGLALAVVLVTSSSRGKAKRALAGPGLPGPGFPVPPGHWGATPSPWPPAPPAPPPGAVAAHPPDPPGPWAGPPAAVPPAPPGPPPVPPASDTPRWPPPEPPS